MEHFDTLLAIADAFVPALDETEISKANVLISKIIHKPEWSTIKAFEAAGCSEDRAFVDVLKARVDSLPASSRLPLDSLLGILSSGGEAALPFSQSTKSFNVLSRNERVKILQCWRDSDARPLTELFNLMKRLVISTYHLASTIAQKAIRYPDHRSALSDIPHELHRPQFREPRNVQEVDIVVIGSGAGGGVIAAKLASKLPEKRIAVVEKGSFVPQEEFPLLFTEAHRMYDGQLGAFISTDGTGAILAGSTWGGSTAINYAGSLELPVEVRKEWSQTFGLEFAESSEFQNCFNRVSKRMGVSTSQIKHNAPNQILIDGATRSGYKWENIPLNTGGQRHDCGLCCYGCRSAVKQSSNVCWLPDAEKAGAICMQNFHVERVTFDYGKTSGIEGTDREGRKISIRAKSVVVAGGALHTPCLLMNSGVKNPLLGENLKVHPCAYTVGSVTSSDTMPWEGSVMTAAISPLHWRNTTPMPIYPPFKLVNMPCYPVIAGHLLPWISPLDWKIQALGLKQTAWTATVIRDTESAGRVRPDERGMPSIVNYDFMDCDKLALIAGVRASCEVQFAAGCMHIQPVVNMGELSVDPFTRPNGDFQSASKEFDRYLTYIDETIKVEKVKKWSAAHPMGTCRMGLTPETSVCNSSGNVWGYPGLYVADASLVPSATGSNPMLTVMALADWVGECIVKSMD